MPQITAYNYSSLKPSEKVEGMINNRGKQELPPEVETLIAIAYDLSRTAVVGPNSENNYSENLICMKGDNSNDTGS